MTPADLSVLRNLSADVVSTLPPEVQRVLATLSAPAAEQPPAPGDGDGSEQPARRASRTLNGKK